MLRLVWTVGGQAAARVRRSSIACAAVHSPLVDSATIAPMPEQQAEEMIAYAWCSNGLTRELAAALLNVTSESPAVQNLLLGDMAENNQAGAETSYQLLRVEQKLDRMGERLENMERRMMAIEAAQVRQPLPANNWDRLLVAIMVLATTALFLYNLIGCVRDLPGDCAAVVLYGGSAVCALCGAVHGTVPSSGRRRCFRQPGAVVVLVHGRDYDCQHRDHHASTDRRHANGDGDGGGAGGDFQHRTRMRNDTRNVD